MSSEYTFITNPDQATPDWLTWVLQQSGRLARGKVAYAHAETVSSYTSTIVRLSLTYSQDAPSNAPTHLFLKLSRPDSHQHVVGNEERRKEVELHNLVAVLMPQPPVVCCYRAAYDAQTGASYLLFDDVAAMHFGGDRSPMPGMAHWEKAIDSFAAWHAFWWDHPALPQFAEVPSEASVSGTIDGIRECYVRFADSAGDNLSNPQRQVYQRVLASLPRLLQRVSQGRRLTLIHGDANPSNVLLPCDTVTGKALIIDWQLWGVSYATEDLSHLIALYWEKDQRNAMERALLMRYHDQLVQHGVKQYDWADCWYDYRLAVIDRVLFMPMWFWNAGVPLSEVWSSLEKAMQAFDDLRCAELLND
jgi:thiamine kinase-like enzyme